jgi:hypothetical protein
MKKRSKIQEMDMKLFRSIEEKPRQDRRILELEKNGQNKNNVKDNNIKI